MKNKILFILIIFLKFAVFGQKQILNYQSFIATVLQHHPIAVKAGLRPKMGEAKVLKAKGGFDVKLKGSINQKYFEQKEYFSYQNYGLEIPTWFGIRLNGGYSNNHGVFINPEKSTSNTDLWNAGLSVNLGNGLWIDKRRAELKQAKIYQESSLLEQQLILNQLLYDASIAYWEWYKAYHKAQIYQSSLAIVQQRFNNIKQSCNAGDKPQIDTLKVYIQAQNRQLDVEKSMLELKNKQAKLEIFLWKEGVIPLEISKKTSPPDYHNNIEEVTPVLIHPDSAVQNHPQLLYYQNNINIAKIETRLKREQLKPKIELRYNALSNGHQNTLAENYSIENYKWGAGISYNLFTRKERGMLKIQELKLREKELTLTGKQAEVQYKLQASYNSVQSLFEQVKTLKNAVEGYQLLFEAEQHLYNVGESTLFLVNTRDKDRVKSLINLLDIIYKKEQAQANYHYQTMRW